MQWVIYFYGYFYFLVEFSTLFFSPIHKVLLGNEISLKTTTILEHHILACYQWMLTTMFFCHYFRASTMQTWHTSLVTRNGGPFYEALEVLVLSLEKLPQCKVGNPNVKWIFSYYKKKERRESTLKH